MGDVVWALKQVMIDIMFVKSKAKPPPRRFADIWDVVAVESKMQQVSSITLIITHLARFYSNVSFLSRLRLRCPSPRGCCPSGRSVAAGNG